MEVGAAQFSKCLGFSARVLIKPNPLTAPHFLSFPLISPLIDLAAPRSKIEYMATMVTGSAREAAWICDWCGKAPGAYWLSTVYVCVACFHETLASSTPRNPQLCERCVELFTSSEYGFVLTTNRTIEFEAGISFAEYNQIRRLQTSDVLFNDKFGGEADDFPRLVVPFYLPNPGTSAETGCPLCRIFLVRDPNTDYDRFRQALDLHGLVRGGWEEVKRRYEEKGNQIVSEPLDIEGFYFESQQEFRLTLSVSALEGKNSQIGAP